MARAKKNTTTATVDNKKVVAEIENMSVFSQSDKDTFARCISNIEVAQRQSEGLAETIAGNLYIINKKELYKLEDYDTIHKFAMEKFDISKGTVSDSINTFERFGDGVTGRVQDKYSKYNFSTLMKLKKFSDEEIETMGVTPEMPRSQVLKAIESYKENKALIDKTPQLRKDWQASYAALCEVMPRPADRVAHVKDVFGDRAGTPVEELTPVELQKAIELTNTLIESIVNDGGDEDENESSTVEQPAAELTVEDQTEEQEAEEEEPHTYPTRTLHIEPFMQEGKVNMDALSVALLEIIQNVVDHNYDIVITY